MAKQLLPAATNAHNIDRHAYKLVMMKLLTLCLLMSAPVMTTAFAPPIHHARLRNAVTVVASRATSRLTEKREALSDMDIMCIMNAADLCSYYDECSIEEREALLNRLEEQTDILSERIAMMTCLVKHLKTGDHLHLEDAETANMKAAILKTVETTPYVAAMP